MSGVSILQLDTHFERIAGDIASQDSFVQSPEIIRIEQAKVPNIVTDKIDEIDIEPFIEAAKMATGDVIATSCGFLAPFQKQIQDAVVKPFIASSLVELGNLHRNFDTISVFTFDAQSLTQDHLGVEHINVIGLNKAMHLRQVIENDLPKLNKALALREIMDLLMTRLNGSTDCLLLECTNLPPYKRAIEDQFDIPCFDILDAIEKLRPNSVRPEFLSTRFHP